MNEELIGKLSYDLENHAKIVVFSLEGKYEREIFTIFQRLLPDIHIDYKLLVLVAYSKINNFKVYNSNITFRSIHQESFEILTKLYDTYEFTNRIVFVKEVMQYPSMLNYFKLGILTERELIEALLH